MRRTARLVRDKRLHQPSSERGAPTHHTSRYDINAMLKDALRELRDCHQA